MIFSVIDAQTYNNGKIGAIVEILVECNHELNNTDKYELCLFVKEILFQIAAASPTYLDNTEVPDYIIENMKNKIANNLKDNYFSRNNHTEKSELHIQRNISKGINLLIRKFYEEECLLSQFWIKDKNKTIQNIIHEKSNHLGMIINIMRFERFGIKINKEII